MNTANMQLSSLDCTFDFVLRQSSEQYFGGVGELTRLLAANGNTYQYCTSMRDIIWTREAEKVRLGLAVFEMLKSLVG